MSPYQHGEVFVTEDGAETDLDIGHYERFVDENLSRNANHTSGSIWYAVIRKERKGEYLGSTVQVIPHITNEIKDRIRRAAQASDADVVICEIGGTVGDIESLPFLEAIRQFRREEGLENVMYVHVTLVPFLEAAGELKTKPTQHSVNELRRIGIHPDIVVCRARTGCRTTFARRSRCSPTSTPKAVISNADIEDVYLVPAALHEEGFDELVCEKLALGCEPADLGEWDALAGRIRARRGDGRDRARRQVREGEERVPLRRGGAEARRHPPRHRSRACAGSTRRARSGRGDARPRPRGRDSRSRRLRRAGNRGQGARARVAREHGIPYLGICLGMQIAVVEFARHVCGWRVRTRASSTPRRPIRSSTCCRSRRRSRTWARRCASERSPSTCSRARRRSRRTPRRRSTSATGTGTRSTTTSASGSLRPGSSSRDIQEGRLVEVIELPDHPWFVASQFHPEFKSRPNRPAPLFRDFIGAAHARAQARRSAAAATPA